MGQFITKSDGNSDIATLAMSAAGFMGIFGTGKFQVFYSGTSNFVVPPNISRLRVRVIGAGGGGGDPAAPGGGGVAAGGFGGGYAHAIYAVTTSTSYVVTVAPAGTSGTSTTQFGSLISVTGRNATIAAQPAPEVGSSYTCDGGFGTSPINSAGGGGGGAGQQIGTLGTGGRGGGFGGQSAFSLVWNARIGAPNLDGNCSATDGTNSNLYIPARFPFDTFTGGGGASGAGGYAGAAGGGGGGGGGASGAAGGAGGIGGGGGGGIAAGGIAASGGAGGIGGGGGGGAVSGAAGGAASGNGGPGLVIVEW